MIHFLFHALCSWTNNKQENTFSNCLLQKALKHKKGKSINDPGKSSYHFWPLSHSHTHKDKDKRNSDLPGDPGIMPGADSCASMQEVDLALLCSSLLWNIKNKGMGKGVYSNKETTRK